MKFTKIVAAARTCSFRINHMSTKNQISLPIPPPSTIQGILSSCKGEFVDLEQIMFGYYFTSETNFIDLEQIYSLNKNGKTDVYKRQCLFNGKLNLYIAGDEWSEIFKFPKHAMLLGRSQDMLCIEKNIVIDMDIRNDVRYGNTYIDYDMSSIPSQVFALPYCFNTQRQEIVRKYSCLDKVVENNGLLEVYYDEAEDMGVYMIKIFHVPPHRRLRK